MLIWDDILRKLFYYRFFHITAHISKFLSRYASELFRPLQLDHGSISLYPLADLREGRAGKLYELILKHQDKLRNESTKKRSSKKHKQTGIARLLSEKLRIQVERYDAEVFRSLVQFVHCGSINITEETVAGLYCGACEFELRDLAETCLRFIEGRVKTGAHTILLNSTRKYSHHTASKTIFDIIYAELDRRFKTYREIAV